MRTAGSDSEGFTWRSSLLTLKTSVHWKSMLAHRRYLTGKRSLYARAMHSIIVLIAFWSISIKCIAPDSMKTSRDWKASDYDAIESVLPYFYEYLNLPFELRSLVGLFASDFRDHFAIVAHPERRTRIIRWSFETVDARKREDFNACEIHRKPISKTVGFGKLGIRGSILNARNSVFNEPTRHLKRTEPTARFIAGTSRR